MEIKAYNLTIGNATDVGKVREHNEDYMAHFDTPMGYCIIVCDGMGGHAAGDVASFSAVESIRHFLQDGKITRIDPVSTLINAIEFANYRLHEKVKENPSLQGMGTTCVIALINNGKMHVANAGDSRLYLIRKKRIEQVSKDHSTVQELIDAGVMTVQEAARSDKKNQITKAVGVFKQVNPTVTNEAIPLLKNDRILLCSDGLTGHLSNQELTDIIKVNKDVQEVSMELVKQANEAGGHDNITAQVVQYSGSVSPRKQKRIRRITILSLIIVLSLGLTGMYYYFLIKPKQQILQKRNHEGDSRKDQEKENAADSLKILGKKENELKKPATPSPPDVKIKKK